MPPSSPRNQQPLRFLHAAQLRLDHAWQGVGVIPQELLPVVEGVTTTAWEIIQRQARELQVDFVLLTGNTLVAADYPLAGEAALIRGLNQLNDFGIPVYLIPGELDPEHYWDAIDHRLPPNTKRLSAHDPEVTICRRGGEGVATIVPISGPTATAGENWIDASYWETWGDQLIDRESPFPIALVHQYPLEEFPDYRSVPAGLEVMLRSSRIRYFASGATLQRWTNQIGGTTWHVPGVPVGFRSGLADSVGCSLVEVDGVGKISLRQLSTSPVRRERYKFAASPLTLRSELVEHLSNQLSKTTIGREERFCWIDLVIQGGGVLLEELQTVEARQQLRQEVFEFTGTEQVPVWIDRIEFQETRSNSELIAGSSRLAGDFLQQLDHLRTLAVESNAGLLESIPAPEGFGESAWQMLRNEMDLEQILTATRSLGAQLLSSRREVVDEDH